MDEAVLEERGHFWWSGTPVPHNCFAPDQSVTGTLRITEDGLAQLDLDGPCPKSPTPLQLGRITELTGANAPAIAGVLRDSRNRVLLWELRQSGLSFSDVGPSFERLTAQTCLVMPGSRNPAPGAHHCVEIELSLDGFDEWLRLGALNRKKLRSGIVLRFTQVKPVRFDLDIGRVTIEFDMHHEFNGFTRGSRAQFEEHAALKLKPSSALNLLQVKEFASGIEDLMILLTDSERSLDWPKIKLSRQSGFGTLYYRRLDRSLDAVSHSDCWTNFPEIKEYLGEIIANWLTQRKRYGPGFYLYLGTRRGATIYEEHRFISLIWGLESMHRTASASNGADPDLTDRISRILMQVTDVKDKKWLKSYLKYAGEPNLQTRLAKIISGLPIRFEAKRLSAFAAECAWHRNDISHFGSATARPEQTSLQRINQLRRALDCLYHAVILLEIGVPREIIENIFEKHRKSFIYRQSFEEVGLLAKDVLREGCLPD